jgi:hypothetical protein
MTLDLPSVSLPDLSDTTKFPTVSHAPFCTDPGPVDPRTCHPGSLIRVRPYELPTEPLGKLKFTWNRLRELIPVPPRIGVHCPTIATSTTVNVGDVGSASQSVETQLGDACLPKLVNNINFPCTSITPTVTLTSVGSVAAAFWDTPTTDRSGNQCNTGINLNLNVPGGGGSSTSGGGFVVGTSGSHAPPFGSDPCATGYAFDDEVPLTDLRGAIGAAGTQLDPLANEVLNKTKTVLVTGDECSAIKNSVQLPGRTQWSIVTA